MKCESCFLGRHVRCRGRCGDCLECVARATGSSVTPKPDLSPRRSNRRRTPAPKPTAAKPRGRRTKIDRTPDAPARTFYDKHGAAAKIMLVNGANYVEVARAFGVTKNCVWWAFSPASPRSRNSVRVRPVPFQEKHGAEARTMFDDGMTYNEIAAHFGVSRNTVYNAINGRSDRKKAAPI